MSNPQQNAARRSKEYTGSPELGSQVDPDTWLTPRWILNHLWTFDLDPCPALSEPYRCAAHAYVIDRGAEGFEARDGLGLDWYGRVFMNPPYSQTAVWLEKHARHGNGISLVPASSESEVWREFVWPTATAIYLLAGRTRFCNPDGSTTTGRPLRGVALIAWSQFDREVLKSAPFAGILLETWGQRR